MTARTRAQKRGRPKMEAVYREPNGRISRAAEPADKLALETRARRLGISLVQAKDQRAETFIGYLAILGPVDGISEAQYDGASKYLKLRAEYLMSLKAPDAARDNEVGGTPSDTISEAYEDWCLDVGKTYNACRTAIQEAQNANRSDNLWAALDLCIIQGQEMHHLIGATRLVCNSLVKFFRC